MKTAIGLNGKLGEPDSHVMMRRLKAGLLGLLIVALLASLLLFLLFRPAAYLAAFPVPVLFLTFVFVSYLEKASRSNVLRRANSQRISEEETEMNVRYMGIYTAMGLIFIMALGTFVIVAAMVEDWAMVGVVAVGMFLLVTLILFPYIPLFLAGTSADERDKLEQEADQREGR